MLGSFTRKFAVFSAALAIAILSQSTAFCQTGGGGNNPGGGGTGAANGIPTGGIEIDAQGVLTQRIFRGNAEKLNRERMKAAQEVLNDDLKKPAEMRKISLPRLEKAVADLIAAGKPIPPEMSYLGGMTKITHVFFYPETNDIVIAGPAEPFFLSAGERVVGMNSGRPVLQLNDLIVALRSFSPGDRSTSMITCSIDPTQEGLARYQNAYARIASSGQFRPGRENEVIRIFRESLGMQKITIQGVSTKTRFARVLVEADYEMKLIGLGLKRPNAKKVKITSYMEKATPSGVSKNALQRWFFQPDYDCVHVNEDFTAMELVGSGVKLVGEGESIARGGQRVRGRGMSGASRAFTTTFTKAYEKLAEQDPLWAELRNLIDLSVTAAYIQKMGLYQKAGWNMETFGDESKVSVELLEAPTQVAPVANAKWVGNYFMSPIAGGVSIQPRVALNSDRINVANSDKLNAMKSEITVDNLSDGQWWWD
ncbi:MAG: DUF1598 domain-containing protein [Planctomycetota bacterium]